MEVIENNNTITDDDINLKMKIRLFPYIDNIKKMHRLKIDNESRYYISIREDATYITNIIKKYLIELYNLDISESIVTDATAGVGGNTISFAMNCKYVNAIEIDSLRHIYLDNNIEVYKLHNVNTYEGDCITILDKLYSDVIFLDPPWGGKDYKLQDKLRLSLSDKSIEEICNYYIDKTKLIVLKLPLNYDLEYMYDNLNHAFIIVIKLNKMLIVIIKNLLES